MAALTGGRLALDAVRSSGVDTMFTLSGAHIFPLYDAAVTAEPAMRIIDVRHEQTAVFAAEATAKLTRTPGFAALTAGPGVTNGVSAITQAHFNGTPLLVLGGRAPAYRWGSGSLQELDHPPLLAPVTRFAGTAETVDAIPGVVGAALRAATTAHRGPSFVDVPMDQLFGEADSEPAPPAQGELAPRTPGTDDVAAVARLLAQAARPVLVLGSDVWTDGAEVAALRFAEATGIPTITNGMGRGVLPGGHRLLVTKGRSAAFNGADLVVVVGTPLDFRLGYGVFGGKDDPPAQVVHIVDAPSQLATHAPLAGSIAGDLTAVLQSLLRAWQDEPRSSYEPWLGTLGGAVTRGEEQAAAVLKAEAVDGLHPGRVYGSLLPLLSDDAVVIGDGGDFVSWAGKLVEPARPGGWLDPGPYGCLGAGLGASIAARLARPDSQVVCLLGDGAAGMSLLDVDTLVRHRLPVVLVVGNNGSWGLEKHPMQMLYGYDVAADLRRETRYDSIVEALGGRGETVSDPDSLDAALRRAFDSGEPYLVNALLDPSVAYPRATTGI